jgi:signal transduction histidine kinase
LNTLTHVQRFRRDSSIEPVESRRSLSIRLLAGLFMTLSAAMIYCGYTLWQIRGLRHLQTEEIDRNRTDSLLLLRIQNDLNSLGLTMHDMLDANEPYPLTAWVTPFQRIRVDLEDAVGREARYAPPSRTSDQADYLAASMSQFWGALDRIFALARTDEKEARAQIRLSLEARQEALSTAVARLLVQNNEGEQLASTQTELIYARVERDVYLFMAALLIVIAATGVYLLKYNRRVLDRLTAMAERRSELAQQLISTQDRAFRSISRELHDEFGQILTAIGIMLQRNERRVAADPGPLRADLRAELREVQEVAQSALEKVRSLSQALHPVVLEEMGLESAVDAYLPVFEKRTGIAIDYQKLGEGASVDREIAGHVYRVLQEALNNVARHSEAVRASVRLSLSHSSLVLEVEDEGIGFKNRRREGLGLVSMRERAEIIHGAIEFREGSQRGALVRLAVPLAAEEEHAAS